MLYPSITWEECVEFARNIDSFKLKSVSYAEAAKKYNINNPQTRSFMSKISTSKQFGIITTSQNTIQLTDTCRRLLYPTDKDIREIKLACFSLPPLYNKLIAAYDGKALPSENILSNVLMAEHGIARSAKDVAAKCFIQSAEQLEILKGGVLGYADSLHNTSDVEVLSIDTSRDNSDMKAEVVVDHSIPQVMPSPSLQYSESDYFTQTVPMNSGKAAKIIIPIDTDPELDKANLLSLADSFYSILKRKFKITREDIEN